MMMLSRATFFTKPYLSLIALVGVIVPRRLRADWRQEWEAELRYRELMLADWDRLDWRNKLELLRRSSSSCWDALLLQPRRWEDDMIQDLRFAVRLLIKNKGFTLVAVLSLALGIGANTAIFSVLDAVLLKSLPVPQPERLVLFGNGQASGVTNGFPSRSWDLFSYPFYQQARHDSAVFSDVAAVMSLTWGVHGRANTGGVDGEIIPINVQLVSGAYFPMLGVRADLGRTLTDADDQILGGHPVTVVSHSWWQRRMGSNPAVIGKTVTIDQMVYTIVGVTPREFFGTTVGEAPDMWVPLAMEKQIPPAYWDGRSNALFQCLNLIGRLKDGVTTEQAQAEVNLRFNQFLQQQAGAQPSADRQKDIAHARVELTPAGRGLSDLRRQFSLSLKILMAVVVVVLLIACANVANLLLARTTARQKEFAARMAIGAGRVRLVRQLFTESLLLASLGGIAGIALAWWGSRLLVLMASSGPQALPLDVRPNLRILAFTLLGSLISAIVFGTGPALRAARIEPANVLRGGKGTVRAGAESLLGKAIVLAQVALSLLLLVGAGLFVRTLMNLENVQTGFNQQNVVLFKIDTSTLGLKGEKLPPLLQGVEDKVRTVPGVDGAAFSFFIFNQGQWSSRAYTRDEAATSGDGRSVRNNVVGADYFAVMGIPLMLGRGFGPQDTDKSQKVAVISQKMAERFFPNSSPLGKRFGVDGPDSANELEIVGVVKDARYGELTEEFGPMAYYPHSQSPQPLDNFVVRYSGSIETMVPQVREAIKGFNQNLPIDDVVSLSDHIGRSLIQQKLVARLASFFGLLALLLACVGLYGILSYAVARRTNEIGIRMALGAQSRDVLWLVLRQALLLVLGGVIVGLGAAYYATRIADQLLFGLKPNDLATQSGATLLLILVATFAGYLPARRASRVEPMVALRDE
jgi:predicted permease